MQVTHFVGRYIKYLDKGFGAATILHPQIALFRQLAFNHRWSDFFCKFGRMFGINIKKS
jgi:hypothetical protein